MNLRELFGGLYEDATSGATSAGNIAAVVSPHIAIGSKDNIKKHGQGKKTKLPKITQKLASNGTAINALDTNTSIFGAPFKR